MFTDMVVSSDLQGKFQEYLKEDNNVMEMDLGLNFYVLVLTVSIRSCHVVFVRTTACVLVHTVVRVAVK